MQRRHYHDYVRHRDLAHTLKLRAGVVSRVGGFVGDEAEGEELGAAKSSSRGKSAGGARGRSKGSIKSKPRR
jgi:hypothetical protein